ncbi:MAG: hypothetical protein V3V10_10640 [Planctomycetota bacterium]
MKPFIAIIIVVVLGLLGIWAWQAFGQGSTSDGQNTEKLPNNSTGNNGPKYINKPFENLPEWDPDYLWPLNGKRMSSPEFPVIWQTEEFSACRLLIQTGPKLWANVGNSAGRRHLVWVDLSKFKSRATFCVEFERRGERFRSKPREVSFGAGARFSQRRYEFDLTRDQEQIFQLQLEGKGVKHLGIESFQHARFEEAVKLAHLTPEGGNLRIVLYNADVFKETEYGYFEVLDSVNNTIDRCMVTFKR